ncbi:MAG: glycosyltransferase family 2 protein [Clostridia bacterium]|nr:glycosyltransferase family 2 protein [Clostridia bacterium]
MDISVIIPIYNTEEYLTECLDSVRKLTELLRVEVILIDDGSTDRSGEIARAFSDANPCFRYIRQQNTGLSAVRNRGVGLAKGKYLLFVDSDDYIFADVYARMFETAEKTGADVTVCDAARLKNNQFMKFQNTVLAFHNLTDTITHISAHPALIYDTASWNKLILRSFYESAGLSFPVGRYYEDMLWALTLHHKAGVVAVVREIGYVYRHRTGENLSITQRMFEEKNMTDKEEIAHRLLSYVREEIRDPRLWLETQKCHCVFHYTARFDALRTFPPDRAKSLFDRFASFIERHYDPRVEPMLSVLEKQIMKDVLSRDFEHLSRVMNYKNINYMNAPVIEENGTACFLLPDSIFTIPDRKTDNEFDAKPPRCMIDKASIRDNALILDGHVYHRRINIRPGDQTVNVYLFNAYTEEKYDMHAEPILCEALTKAHGTTVNADDHRTYRYNYDGAGFRVRLDLADLAKKEITPGVYMLMLQYRNRIFSGARLLRGVSAPARRAVKEFRSEINGLRIETDFDVLDTLRITIRRPPEQ